MRFDRVAFHAGLGAALSPVSNLNINLQTEEGKDCLRLIAVEVCSYRYRR
ncbi:hypothetical protein [Neisseria iguanae]|nr:hypothetical protein [Neisseria iguanae]